MRLRNKRVKARHLRPILAIGALLAAGGVAGTGCGDDETVVPPGPTTTTTTGTSMGGAGGTGAGQMTGGGGAAQEGGGGAAPVVCASVTEINQVANGDFVSPFDAVPSPNGEIVYFTALTNAGEPALLSAPAGGGAASVLHAGDPLVAPFGIAMSTDGETLYITDPGADDDDTSTTFAVTRGLLLAVDTSGADPTPIGEATGLEPRGLDVAVSEGADFVYFSGRDVVGGGVFYVAAAGGDVNAYDAVLQDPSGVAAAADGTVFVADSIGGTGGLASIFEVSGAAAVPIVEDIDVAYPVGLALLPGEGHLIVSGLTSGGADVLLQVDLSDNSVTEFDPGVADGEAGGIHAAGNAAALSWVDGRAGDTGTVYLLTCE